MKSLILLVVITITAVFVLNFPYEILYRYKINETNAQINREKKCLNIFLIYLIGIHSKSDNDYNEYFSLIYCIDVFVVEKTLTT